MVVVVVVVVEVLEVVVVVMCLAESPGEAEQGGKTLHLQTD